MKKIALFLTLIFCLNSCSNQRFILNKYYKVAKKVSYSEKKTFNKWGIGNEQILYNPQSYCPKGEILAKIEFKQRNYPLELVTLGYLQPRSIDIYCINSDLYKIKKARSNQNNSLLSKVDKKINYICAREYKTMKKEFSMLDKDNFMHQCSINKRKIFIELGL